MRWSYGAYRAEVRLPFAAHDIAAVAEAVRAGDVVARGEAYRATRRIDAARALGCLPGEVAALLRAKVGDAVRRDAVIARAGRRFPRAIVARDDGRVVHLGADGALYVGTVRREWVARAPLDGLVRRADPHAVVVEGEAWALAGLAGFGPDRAGALALGVARADDELAAARLDVEVAGAILVAGRRASGEALTRAHAVGAHAVVSAAASFRALRVVYGEGASAFGLPTDEDVPTLLVLAGFGAAPFPEELFARLAPLAGARAAVDARAARLYVFAPPSASEPYEAPPAELAPDLSALR